MFRRGSIESQKQIESLSDNIPEHVKAYLKGLAIQNPQKTFELADIVKKIDLIFNNLSQPTKDRFYKSLMNLILVDHDKAYSLATWIRDNNALLNRVKQCTKSEHYEYVINLSFTNREKAHALATLIVKVNNQFNKIRQSTRDKFFDPIIELAYTDRDDALVLANVVKEIDCIVSGIANKDLLDYFDQFFTFTETQHVHERTKVIAFARKCKEIDDADIPDIEKKPLAVQAKLHPEISLPEGIIKPTEVVSYLGTTSSCLGAVTSKVNSCLSFISGVSEYIQSSIKSNYFGH
ncbi:hypothetical protein [Wolbachia endosymbiont (group E) of Neria commutata]|uniref:hypothetical protein n=1 Tax=Wolbachia endosymbiont (group E) of Neria commutata TaxID=3066149 RepID=UPI003133185B